MMRMLTDKQETDVPKSSLPSGPPEVWSKGADPVSPVDLTQEMRSLAALSNVYGHGKQLFPAMLTVASKKNLI